MRIVSRKTFLALPAGTVFAKFHDDRAIETVEVKWDSLLYKDDGDFVSQTLIPQFEGWSDCSHFFNTLDRMADDESVSAVIDYDCCGRDGLFDRDQKFAIWEADDLDKLIGVLTDAKAASAL